MTVSGPPDDYTTELKKAAHTAFSAPAMTTTPEQRPCPDDPGLQQDPIEQVEEELFGPPTPEQEARGELTMQELCEMLGKHAGCFMPCACHEVGPPHGAGGQGPCRQVADSIMARVNSRIAEQERKYAGCFTHDQYHDGCNAIRNERNRAEARAEAAEQSLRVAREALEKIAGMFTVQQRTGIAGLNGSLCVGEVYEVARAALTEAGGK